MEPPVMKPPVTNEPVDLTIDECLSLLMGSVVGRVAMSTPMGPRIVPVNYAMRDGAIVFRTTPYSELGTYGRDVDVAFEIDDLDHDRHGGWSVVAVGRAEAIGDPDELDEIRGGWDPIPWAGGRRHLYLKLRWRDLSGRRVGRAYVGWPGCTTQAEPGNILDLGLVRNLREMR